MIRLRVSYMVLVIYNPLCSIIPLRAGRCALLYRLHETSSTTKFLAVVYYLYLKLNINLTKSVKQSYF